MRSCRGARPQGHAGRGPWGVCRRPSPVGQDVAVCVCRCVGVRRRREADRHPRRYTRVTARAWQSRTGAAGGQSRQSRASTRIEAVTAVTDSPLDVRELSYKIVGPGLPLQPPPSTPRSWGQTSHPCVHDRVQGTAPCSLDGRAILVSRTASQTGSVGGSDRYGRTDEPSLPPQRVRDRRQDRLRRQLTTPRRVSGAARAAPRMW